MLSGAPPPGRNATGFFFPLRMTSSQSRSHSVSFRTMDPLPISSAKPLGAWRSTQFTRSAFADLVGFGGACAGAVAALTAAGGGAAEGSLAINCSSVSNSGHFFPFSLSSKYFLYLDVSSTARPSSKREPTTRKVVFPEQAPPTFPPAALTFSSASCRDIPSSSPVKQKTMPASGRPGFPAPPAGTTDVAATLGGTGVEPFGSVVLAASTGAGVGAGVGTGAVCEARGNTGSSTRRTFCGGSTATAAAVATGAGDECPAVATPKVGVGMPFWGAAGLAGLAADTGEGVAAGLFNGAGASSRALAGGVAEATALLFESAPRAKSSSETTALTGGGTFAGAAAAGTAAGSATGATAATVADAAAGATAGATAAADTGATGSGPVRSKGSLLAVTFGMLKPRRRGAILPGC
mmetsp:Transcript_126738/g.316739  ORF Transcript_126738/g.316739 Transcript_126738/m.316739 type:complete len:408 (-) Transcript_126738:151-1374(-)